MSELFDNNTIDALKIAMRGLALRQRAGADNVANAETPGFRAGKVEFESQLREALAAHQDPDGVVPLVRRSAAAPGPNGNNVDLTAELTGTTGLQYKLVVEALNFKYRTLRSAVGG